MERYDIEEAGRLSEMVSAAERGEDVEITRGGKVVARVVVPSDLMAEQLAALRSRLPAEALRIDWGEAVRAMRDAG